MKESIFHENSFFIKHPQYSPLNSLALIPLGCLRHPEHSISIQSWQKNNPMDSLVGFDSSVYKNVTLQFAFEGENFRAERTTVNLFGMFPRSITAHRCWYCDQTFDCRLAQTTHRCLWSCICWIWWTNEDEESIGKYIKKTRCLLRICLPIFLDYWSWQWSRKDERFLMTL